MKNCFLMLSRLKIHIILVLDRLVFVMRSATRRLWQLCCGNTIYSISILSLRKKCMYDFATTKLVLLPSPAPDSKRLLPPKKRICRHGPLVSDKSAIPV